MKNATILKLFSVLFLIVFSSSIKADPWDNLTLDEAKQVQSYLETNPFIFDYCDCCDFKGEYATKIHFMKVESTKIVACDWDPAFYSVKAKVRLIAEIPYKEYGPDINSLIKKKLEDYLTITMNYTWVYSESEKKSVPFFCVIPYSNESDQSTKSGVCRAFTTFPYPIKIENAEYAKW